MKTENLAIILTDIVGYTEATSRLSRKEQKEMLSLHNQLLFPIIRSFGGKVVKTIGDALLLVFRSPTDGMLCSMAMQDALYDFNRKSMPEQKLHIRIAASLGEVRVARNDVFGEAVNLTSRIESITPQDEIYLSEAVYLAMNKAEVPCVEVGLRELKGISEPVKIWQIPRFTRARLVPEDVGEEEIDELSYPYGGAHLDVVTKGSKSGSDQASKKPLLIGLLVLGLVVIGAAVWSLPAGTFSSLFSSAETEIAEQSADEPKEATAETKPEPVAAREAAPPEVKPAVKKVAKATPKVAPKPAATVAPKPAPKTTPAVVKNPYAELISRLESGNGAEMRSAAREVYNEQTFARAVLDAMTRVLEQNYEVARLDRNTADALAWYCKVLAQSADSRYLPILEKVTNGAGNAKLRKYAARSYQDLQRAVN
ncbi:MAG: hypothetical protein C0623_05020 [Desulfuromonas sp.]|nr:MAG: hypothetical protein C0623_05020 [Desulfuromonas sp.]